MKLWLLTNTDGGGYDQYDGYVIAASSEENARAMANERPADEGPIWEDPSKSTCEHIGESLKDEACIVLSDFHAG